MYRIRRAQGWKVWGSCFGVALVLRGSGCGNPLCHQFRLQAGSPDPRIRYPLYKDDSKVSGLGFRDKSQALSHDADPEWVSCGPQGRLVSWFRAS